MDFDQFIASCRPAVEKRIAVACAADETVLEAVIEAHARGLGTAVLCGDPPAIRAAAEAAGLDISPFAVHPAATPTEAAGVAVDLIRRGEADILMKGLMQTADMLRAVLNKETGIRGRGVLSLAGILRSPALGRSFFITDPGMCVAPDLKMKVEMVRNAVTLARALGVERPKVAILAAVEVVNPDMPATLDAAALTVMNRRGQIRDCIIDGPLSLDLALSPESARHKDVVSEVAGRADILVCPDIATANCTYKAFTLGGGCVFGGVVLGAAAPLVVTSRSDSKDSKLCALACATALVRQDAALNSEKEGRRHLSGHCTDIIVGAEETCHAIHTASQE